MLEEKLNCGKKPISIIVAIVLVLLGLYLVSLIRNSWEENAYIGKSPEFQDRVTITGEGKVSATPDVAVINIGIVTEKDDVSSAQSENSRKMNEIIDSLKSQFKISDEDIQTSQYSIYPRYDWSQDVRKIIGYGINQAVKVKVRDFEKIGDILAKAGDVGANSISGPTFTIDNPEVYREEARKLAIDQAKKKAKTLAKEVGFGLGDIVNFSENTGSAAYPYYEKSMAYGLGGAAESVSPDIEAGGQEVVVNISISYEIR